MSKIAEINQMTKENGPKQGAPGLVSFLLILFGIVLYSLVLMN